MNRFLKYDSKGIPRSNLALSFVLAGNSELSDTPYVPFK
jgi:hypothetical protein